MPYRVATMRSRSSLRSVQSFARWKWFVADNDGDYYHETAYRRNADRSCRRAFEVTGQAQYTADMPLEHVAYAVMVTSTIAHGKITSIDTSATGEIQGILKIFTHENSPRFTQPEADFMKALVPAQTFMPMQGPDVVHYGQQVAVVVAETLRAARAAAARVRVSYEPSPPCFRLTTRKRSARNPSSSSDRLCKQSAATSRNSSRPPR